MRLPLPQFGRRDGDGDRFSEVIETSTTEFLAQCLDSDSLKFPTMPPFGSWVKAQDEESGNTVYAVVYHATTMPIDSVHRAQALGLSLEELREQQPQIFAMLKTEFRAAIVGFTSPEERRVYQYLPPRPPQIHQAVSYCSDDEVIRFTEDLEFLRTLLQVASVPVESLAAAAVRQVYRTRKADRDWLVRAGRTLSWILKDDYDRLRSILSQIHP
ncbi:hypothetical protein CKA32_006679 [Geitlerinema sp. FC II]|uniref:HAS-barrel domain-containing protein n=1 Tax=Baaleninema simplex TaxID=2862350 RepID=UPI00034CD1A7|nr:HAS-barrel domain-containing protein [Baaleninema simplex]PPT10685.1 hypothetical protein CKA32_006679 [Geitlerinema sp. FC II]